MSEEYKRHEVVELLLARMKSHPEEFVVEGDGKVNSAYHRRWSALFEKAKQYSTKEDRSLLNRTFNNIQLDAVYAKVIDELANGEERRAEAKRKLEEAAKARRNTIPLRVNHTPNGSTYVINTPTGSEVKIGHVEVDAANCTSSLYLGQNKWAVTQR